MQTKRNPISDSSPVLSPINSGGPQNSALNKGLCGSPPEVKAGGRYRREEHLKKRVEITRVFKKGRAVSCSGCKLFFIANELPRNRIVITFARKYGNAVQRNRARRLGREAYRLMKSGLKTGYDLVLLIYPRTESPAVQRGIQRTLRTQRTPGTRRIPGTLAETAGQLKTLFNKAGLF